MKKLMIAALAVASCTAFAGEFDSKAEAEGFYDVQLTTKRLVHVEKKISKSYSIKNADKIAAYEAAYQVALAEAVPGTEILAETNSAATSVKLTYTRYDFTTKNGEKVYKSKVVSESFKGLYAASAGGKVYLWSAAAADKAELKSTDVGALPFEPKYSKNVEKAQKGFKAYEVPLAMHGEFIETQDNKVAGGFLGGMAKAEDGELLDFRGLTAFGTGTKDTEAKGGLIKSVAGNVAAKYDTDNNSAYAGAYGTWKINRVTTKNFPEDIKAALVKKGCVELVEEIAE